MTVTTPSTMPLGSNDATAPLLTGNGSAWSADPIEAYVAHLTDVHAAVVEVATAVHLLAACRYAPAPIVEAAVTDLAQAMRGLQALGPAGGGRTLADHEADVQEVLATRPDPRVAVLRAAIRRSAADIERDSADLSLELRRLMADLRDVVSLGTGSTGTYDALGRTTLGERRRRHAVM